MIKYLVDKAKQKRTDIANRLQLQALQNHNYGSSFMRYEAG